LLDDLAVGNRYFVKYFDRKAHGRILELNPYNGDSVVFQRDGSEQIETYPVATFISMIIERVD